MGTVDVICIDPVKLFNPSRGPILAAPWAFGASRKEVVPNRLAPELRAVTVTVAAVAEGYWRKQGPCTSAQKSTNSVVGVVVAFTLASPCGTVPVYRRYSRAGLDRRAALPYWPTLPGSHCQRRHWFQCGYRPPPRDCRCAGRTKPPGKRHLQCSTGIGIKNIV